MPTATEIEQIQAALSQKADAGEVPTMAAFRALEAQRACLNEAIHLPVRCGAAPVCDFTVGLVLLLRCCNSVATEIRTPALSELCVCGMCFKLLESSIGWRLVFAS